MLRKVPILGIFLSTLSLRRATPSITGYFFNAVHFYPRSPYGERPDGLFFIDGRNGISIHALLTESDERTNRLAHAPPHISIHALLTESDTYHRYENLENQ